MKEFTVYDATGRILRSGVCQDDMFDAQAKDGEFLLPGQLKDSVQYIDVGTKKPVLIPASPDPTFKFNHKTKTWVDPRSDDDKKKQKWNDIKKDRDDVEFGKFTYKAMKFDGDEASQRRMAIHISLSKSAIAAGKPYSTQYILADGSIVTLQAEDFVAIEAQRAVQITNAFVKAAQLRNKLKDPKA